MTRTVAVAIVCTLVVPAPMSAQGHFRDSIAREAARTALTVTQNTTAPDPWNAVRALKPDTLLKVIRRDGRKVIGSFVSADADHITIDKRWGRHETLPRTDVHEIRLRSRRSTAASAGIGLVSGYAAGASAGWIAGCSGECTGDERAQGVVLGGAFGGSVGFWVGLIRGAATNLRPGRLVYREP